MVTVFTHKKGDASAAASGLRKPEFVEIVSFLFPYLLTA